MVQSKCQYFGICGGCSLQDRDYPSQLKEKEGRLKQILSDVGQIEPEEFITPLAAEPWHYRHRARLTVRRMKGDGSIRVGFRERQKSARVTDMEQCPILPEHISGLLVPLRQMIAQLSDPGSIAQLDLAATERTTAFVVRHMSPLEKGDLEVLESFSEQHDIHFYVQPGGVETITPLNMKCPGCLTYLLEDYDVVLQFHPAEFTQVNPVVNRLMVCRVVELLAPEQGENIADLFSGIGNFSLPLARKGAIVTGMEFSERQVQHARENAKRNGLSKRVQFVRCDLSCASQALGRELASFGKILLDPPRSGAPAVVASLQDRAPHIIVYVSCSPNTLARDAQVLVKEKGYQFKSVGLVDMFPHTDHVEAVGVFERVP